MAHVYEKWDAQPLVTSLDPLDEFLMIQQSTNTSVRIKGSTILDQITPNLFANALFVDASYGLNAGAVPDSMMSAAQNPISHKYQTITAAKNAASTGDLIVVFPGEYDEAFVNIYKNGVSYYFYPGVTAQVSIIPTAAGHACYIYGYGDFIGDISCCMLTTIGSYLYFQFNSVDAVRNSILIQDGIADIFTNLISSQDQGAIQVSDSDPASDGTNDIRIHANNIRSFGTSPGLGATINVSSSVNGYDGKLLITSNNIKGSPSSSSPTIHLDNYVVPNDRTYIRIDCPLIEPGTLSDTTPVVVVEYNNNTKVEINGNIVMPTANRIGISFSGDNSGSIFNFKGNIITEDNSSIDVLGSNNNIYLDGMFESNHTQTINLNTIIASTNTITINGYITNTQASGNGIEKVQSTTNGCSLVIDTLKIVTNAGVAINAPALDTIKVIHSLACNTDTLPAIGAINSITGSTAYFDAGVE